MKIKGKCNRNLTGGSLRFLVTGLQREPKWSHLKDLHKALNLAKKPLLNGVSRPAELLAHDVEVIFQF